NGCAFSTQSRKIAMDFYFAIKIRGQMSFVSGAPYWIEESGTRIEIRYRNWQAMVFGTLLVGAAILCGLLFHSRIPPVFQGLSLSAPQGRSWVWPIYCPARKSSNWTLSPVVFLMKKEVRSGLVNLPGLLTASPEFT